MANKERGEYGIVVKGRPYTLRPTLNAMCDAESITGKTAAQLLQESVEGSVNASRALLWSYLQEYHGDEFKTLKSVGKWVEEAGGLDAVNAVLLGLEDANKDDTPKGEQGNANPPDAQVGTGDDFSSKAAVLA